MPTHALPQLAVDCAVLSNGPADKNTETAALTRSRSHKVPEGAKHNTITGAYELTDEERQQIADGAVLYVGQVCYQAPPNDILVHVGHDVAARFYAVDVRTDAEAKAELRQRQSETHGACESVAAIVRQIDDEHHAWGSTAIDLSGVEYRDHNRRLAALERRLENAYGAVGTALRKMSQARINAGVKDE